MYNQPTSWDEMSREHKKVAYCALILIAGLSATQFYFGPKVKEELHKNLPTIVQSYDTNRNGILETSELEVFIRDYDFQHKTNTLSVSSH